MLNLYREPLLTQADEIELARKIQAARDKEASPKALREGRRARDRMVMANAKLVRRVARRYGGLLPFDDLFQFGILGLIYAADTFDPERGTRFSTWAFTVIHTRIQQGIDNTARTVRIPTGAAKIQWKIQRYLERNPGSTADELAEIFSISIERAKVLMNDIRVVSLNAKNNQSNRELADVIPSLNPTPQDLLDDRAEVEAVRMAVADFLQDLPELQRRVLIVRYGLDGSEPLSLLKAAEALNMNRDSLRRLEEKVFRQIRRATRSRP